jgi:hypothetical protein
MRKNATISPWQESNLASYDPAQRSNKLSYTGQLLQALTNHKFMHIYYIGYCQVWLWVNRDLTILGRQRLPIQ